MGRRGPKAERGEPAKSSLTTKLTSSEHRLVVDTARARGETPSRFVARVAVDACTPAPTAEQTSTERLSDEAEDLIDEWRRDSESREEFIEAAVAALAKSRERVSEMLERRRVNKEPKGG